MSLVSFSLRFLLLWILFVLPSMGIGFLTLGRTGAFLTGAIVSLYILWIAFWNEKIIIRKFAASPPETPELERSLAWAIKDLECLQPKLLVFTDTSPNALVVRSCFGCGSILISQGLITLLNEAELRAILRLCTLRVRSQTLVLQSTCSLIIVHLLRILPRTWVKFILGERELLAVEEKKLGSSSVIVFLAIFPLIRLLLRVSEFSQGEKKNILTNSTSNAAIQKITQTIAIWSPEKKHEFYSLYLVDPGFGKTLIPY